MCMYKNSGANTKQKKYNIYPRTTKKYIKNLRYAYESDILE